MSFQITILKVLAGHPEGQASLADLTRYVSVLTSSGADWSQRMKRLAARAPGLDIFTSGYVLREGRGWRITDAGRLFLASIEAPAASEPEIVIQSPAPSPVIHFLPDLPQNVIPIAGYEGRRRRAA